MIPDKQLIRLGISQLIAEQGIPGAQHRTHLKKEALIRIAAGLNVRDGTWLQAAVALGLVRLAPGDLAVSGNAMAIASSGTPTL